MPGIDVSEIHAYPSKPEGFEDPLFSTAESNLKIVEHLLEAPWLSRVSELVGRAGGAAHALEEPVELTTRNSPGRMDVLRLGAGRRRRDSWRRRSVEKVLDRWREVWGWWDEDRCRDRMVFRVLLSGGVVVDLARKQPGGWLLVGVVD